MCLLTAHAPQLVTHTRTLTLTLTLTRTLAHTTCAHLSFLSHLCLPACRPVTSCLPACLPAVAEILVVTANDAVHEGLSILKNYILEEFNVTELTLRYCNLTRPDSTRPGPAFLCGRA